jgi:hypothetical protein
VFQQIPWFATTDAGTVDLNTSFNHGNNDQPPQQQQQLQQQQQTQQHTNNANSYKQKRSVVSALSSFRKNQQNLSKIFGRCSPPFTKWKKEDGNANLLLPNFVEYFQSNVEGETGEKIKSHRHPVVFGVRTLFDLFKTLRCRETVPLIRVRKRNTSQGARTVGQPGRRPFPTQAGDPVQAVQSSLLTLAFLKGQPSIFLTSAKKGI